MSAASRATSSYAMAAGRPSAAVSAGRAPSSPAALACPAHTCSFPRRTNTPHPIGGATATRPPPPFPHIRSPRTSQSACKPPVMYRLRRGTGSWRRYLYVRHSSHTNSDAGTGLSVAIRIIAGLHIRTTTQNEPSASLLTYGCSSTQPPAHTPGAHPPAHAEDARQRHNQYCER